MTWVKVDDDFYDHPKFIDRNAAEIGLWLLGLAYCNRYLTDGFISVRALRRTYPEPDAETLADQLVHAGLWEVTEGGWLVHDYHDRQPSAETVKRRQKEQADKGRKGAESRWGTPAGSHRLGTPDGNSNACGHSNSYSNGHDPSNAKRDAPSRPVPNVVRDAVLDVSSRLSGGPGDDDERVLELAKDACDLIGKLRFDGAAAQGKVEATKKAGRRSYLRTCRRNAWLEQGGIAIGVAAEHPDWAVADVAAEVERRSDEADTLAPVVQLDPQCAECGGLRHRPDHPHLLPDEERQRIREGGAS